jgi:hypothetical protein
MKLSKRDLNNWTLVRCYNSQMVRAASVRCNGIKYPLLTALFLFFSLFQFHLLSHLVNFQGFCCWTKHAYNYMKHGQNISAGVHGGLCGGSSRHRPGCEDPIGASGNLYFVNLVNLFFYWLTPRHKPNKVFAGIDGGLCGGSSVQRPGIYSFDPGIFIYCLEWLYLLVRYKIFH